MSSTIEADARARLLASKHAYYVANKEKHRAWYTNNRERVKATVRAWYVANRERIRARKRAWYATHKEAHRKWYIVNREKNTATKSAYQIAHKEQIAERCRIYYAEHKERWRAYYDANADKIRERARKRHIANKDRERVQGIAYRAAHKDKIKAYNDAHKKDRHGWYAANRERLIQRGPAMQQGLPREQVRLMYEKQAGRCAACGAPAPLRGRGCLHVDHDHGTGVVRGLLCRACNVALGFLRDNSNRAERAAAYLRAHAAEQAGLPVSDAA